MKVKTIQALQCPECGEHYIADTVPEPHIAWQCGECEAIYTDKDEAKDCCKE